MSDICVYASGKRVYCKLGLYVNCFQRILNPCVTWTACAQPLPPPCAQWLWPGCKSHLDPQWLLCGSRGGQVLQVTGSFVREHSSGCLVFSVPLDGPATVEEVRVGFIAPKSQKIPCCSHLLHCDVPRSLWDQPNVYIAWQGPQRKITLYYSITSLHAWRSS